MQRSVGSSQRRGYLAVFLRIVVNFRNCIGGAPEVLQPQP